MNIDVNLMLTIAGGVLLASLVKHVVVVGLNQIFCGNNAMPYNDKSGCKKPETTVPSS